VLYFSRRTFEHKTLTQNYLLTVSRLGSALDITLMLLLYIFI